MNPRVIALAALSCTALGLGLLVYLLVLHPPRARPLLGHHGLQRAHALERNPLFRLSEPLIRQVATWVEHWPAASARAHLSVLLHRSGDYLGLQADELIAMSLLTAALGASLGALIGPLCDFGSWPAAPACLLGLSVPLTRVSQAIARRKKEVSRALPPTIDLLSLCMSAGLDFSAALGLVLQESSLRGAALGTELRRILQALDLGQTRREALLAFAERVPHDAVRDFVNAVVQAEQKGTPLSAVLEIQARMLRLRRSVMAEEAAARAAVLLVLPLMLLLACIMTVMFGPFAVNGIGI